MRWLFALACVIAVTGCSGCTRKAQGEQVPGAVPGMAPQRVGSVAFHLEIAAVYERFRDYSTAVDHLAKAAAGAGSPAERAQVYTSIGRVKRSAGDREGAIEALERARHEAAQASAAQPARGRSFPGPMTPFGAGDPVEQLVHLYSEKGEHERALQLCRSASGADPWRRDQLLRLEVGLLRKTGKLEARTAEAEKTLDTKPPDEAALRFLAVALAPVGGPGGTPGGMFAPPPSGAGVPAAGPAVPDKLVQVNQLLLELHPDDAQLRHTVQSLLERTGRIDEAVALARAAPGATEPQCGGPLALGPPSPSVQRAAEIVRLRLRAGQKDKALAETSSVVALASQEGVSAYLAAADLFLEQNAPRRAEEALQRAGAVVRTRDDRRRLAVARLSLLDRTARPAEAKKLADEWARSDDPCLRVASQRRAQLATAAALAAPPPQPLPPPPRPPPPEPPAVR